MKLHLPALLFLAVGACHSGLPEAARPDALPWKIQPDGWREDPAWYDGTAEKCVYQASRPIYGVERSYLATAYTNKQAMDRGTSTKPSDGQGTEVFKHHWSERIETERYDYDFSTASFTTTDRFLPFKLTASTQEDCGASFKQVWWQGERLRRWESVYFPDAGVIEGTLGRSDIVFEDALPLVLRDFPFEQGGNQELWVLPSQKSTKRAAMEPQPMRVESRGQEELELPVGTLAAQRLDLVEAKDGKLRASFWFASASEAPWMHVLLQYEAADGVRYALASHERTAYWER